MSMYDYDQVIHLGPPRRKGRTMKELAVAIGLAVGAAIAGFLAIAMYVAILGGFIGLMFGAAYLVVKWIAGL